MSLTALIAGTEDARIDPPHGTIGCPCCGLVQNLPETPGAGVIHCRRCDAPLERTAGRSLDAALACSVTTLILLVPAITLPLMRVSLLGSINRSTIEAGVGQIWGQGWPALSVVIGMELIVAPFLRFGLLTAVLGMLRAGRRAAWLGPAFRISERLDEWAMIDVFLIGCLVGYSRVAPFMPVEIGVGGYSVIAAAFLTMITRATMERRAIWRMIGPDASHGDQKSIACDACDHIAPQDAEGGRCPRCGDRLWRQRPHSMTYALAFTLAGLVLYPIAYLYPMEINIEAGTSHAYSILTGIIKLFQAGLWELGVILFIASVGIPLVKLFGIVWIILSSYQHSTSRLRLKGKIYRIIVTIGRWSHIDVYTVAVFLPLMHIPGLLSVNVADGMPAFLAVVVLTMAATNILDPRHIWIAAKEGHPHDRSG
ncbi:MAG TPA: paraquat-inducible protein A [Acidiphilium sp.]